MTVSIIIRGVKYEITRDDILRVATSVHPASIRTYYVEVQGKRFPPKQLIRLATGTPWPFNSANARSALTRLGFHVEAVG
jgi:5-methylcytosine-specific restriction protein B